MKITLKKFQHAAFASQETYCFSADVLIDGKKAGCAENDGHGGCTSVHLTEAFRHLDTPENDIEGKVDAECHKLVCAKQDKSLLARVKRDLSKNILFRRKNTPVGESRIIRGIVGTSAYEGKIAQLKADPDVVEIYNLMSVEQATKALYPDFNTVG